MSASCVSIHEAGHAVMAFLLGEDVEYVTIVPGDWYEGLCAGGPGVVGNLRSLNSADPVAGGDVDAFHRHRAMVFLAGGVAEEMHLGNMEAEGCQIDWERALDHVTGIFGVTDIEKMITDLQDATRTHLETDAARSAVVALASALEAERTVDGSRAKAIAFPA